MRNSNAQIIDCIIENNEVTSGSGGGIYIDGSSPQITGCLIQGNKAFPVSGEQGNGGGIAIFESFPVITNCVISGNTANGNNGGGGVWTNDGIVIAQGGSNSTCAEGCSGNNRIRLTNCLIVGNSAPDEDPPNLGRGGGLYLGMNDTATWTEISNCTISGNTAAGLGDGIFSKGRCFTLVNSILWDDASGVGSELALEGSTAFVRYSDVEDGLGSNVSKVNGGLVCEETTSCGVSGNINTNPNFCGAPADYRLCRVSPCIDAGDNAGVPSGITVDLDDAPRFVNDLCTTDTGCETAPIVDMGAYEFQVVQAQIDGDWKSLVTHGASNTIGLDVLADSTFSESRNGGVTKLRLNFSSPIDPATVSAGNVVICGNDVNSQAVNLSGITVTTTVLSGNAAVDINFSPKLPNYARYRVHLDDVEDVDCNVISANNERIFTSLFGDATRDLRVLQADVGYVNSLVGTSPIDPNTTPQVRSDVDNDNDIDSTDVSLVAAEVPKTGAPSIANPSCP